ncbi:ribokinase [Listeria grandensis]|uniref:Ribokinase n=1 Tax=Listeria grandensis FSL F6-0971 TaxID=1265819 RepID=W7BCW0_9LIST|nr:ribokinase [Listeria grandensis]EUJ24949.1 ribokinase [Listeria grandensis FSL F6-0971]MBC1473034.1 ribokinase [Listeria grandensis]
MGKIVVIGSINMDIATELSEMPQIGETVKGNAAVISPGGKGANQAVAAAKLGGDVMMVGMIGNDAFGADALANLNSVCIDVTHVRSIDATTGLAMILRERGDNRIIVAPGANHAWPSDLPLTEIISEASIVLLQNEIPFPIIEKVVDIAARYHVPTIFDPAPVDHFPVSFLRKITYLTPNESESKQLPDDMLHGKTEALLVTLGKEGVQLCLPHEKVTIPAVPVDVKDSTGAGDTFNGAFAVAITSGKSLQEAVRFANKAAAISTTKIGAQSGMPILTDIES